MTYEKPRADVAVFIDFENVYVSVRDKLDANPNFEAIMDRCSDLGRVVIARAYADWYRYPRVTSALYANAIDPIYVATYFYDKDMGRTGRAIKNSVDMHLCIDAMKTLYTSAHIAKFVLVTGDRDFIPLVNCIRQLGKEVIVVGIGGAASTHLGQAADEFIFYEQLIGRTPTPPTRGRQPQVPNLPERAVELPAEEPETVEPVRSAAAAKPAPTPPPASEPDVYDVLVEAIQLVRKRGYVSTLGSIKLVMKELMGGDFKESRYKDLAGRPFVKFKDFVMDAEKRGKVQIFTNGTVNEVFLPGEDPYKLSQFAADLEKVAEALANETASNGNGKEPPAAAAAVVAEAAQPASSGPNGRRRRRRSRGGRGSSTGQVGTTAELQELQELEGDEVFEAPEGVEPIMVGEDELLALADLEEPAEIEQLSEDQFAEELAAAQLSDEMRDAAEAMLAANYEHQPFDDEPFLEAIEDEFIEPEAELQVVEEPASAELAEADPVEVEPVEVEPVEVEAEPVGAGTVAEPGPESAPELAGSAELVEAEPAVPAEIDSIATEEPSTPEGEGDEASPAEEIAFADEEWVVFRTMMSGFSKPASFQQIFDTLRGLRKDQQLVRTNEQLRSLVKQAINSGLLERSGRGKRIYYQLRTTSDE
jgi:uncharacterized protein (TIGR00288 family)